MGSHRCPILGGQLGLIVCLRQPPIEPRIVLRFGCFSSFASAVIIRNQRRQKCGGFKHIPSSRTRAQISSRSLRRQSSGFCIRQPNVVVGVSLGEAVRCSVIFRPCNYPLRSGSEELVDDETFTTHFSTKRFGPKKFSERIFQTEKTELPRRETHLFPVDQVT